MIGEDITEQLDVESAKFFVHWHIRPQYACRSCETITAAPIPPAVIDGGMAAIGLLAWVMVGKFVDHLALYRLEQMAVRDQVILSRSTLADWVGRVGLTLQPLADRLAWHLLQGNTIHADEMPVPQLDPGRLTFGRTVATIYNPIPGSLSSSIRKAGVVNMPSSFWATGKVSAWLMVMAAIRPCLPTIELALTTSRWLLVLNWRAWHMPTVNFSIYIRRMVAQWRGKHCSALAVCMRLKRKPKASALPPARNCAWKKASPS